jgi:hypothetical protein
MTSLGTWKTHMNHTILVSEIFMLNAITIIYVVSGEITLL